MKTLTKGVVDDLAERSGKEPWIGTIERLRATIVGCFPARTQEEHPKRCRLCKQELNTAVLI